MHMRFFDFFQQFLPNLNFMVPKCTKTIPKRSDLFCLKYVVMGFKGFYFYTDSNHVKDNLKKYCKFFTLFWVHFAT